jgi:hypothetical protein
VDFGGLFGTQVDTVGILPPNITVNGEAMSFRERMDEGITSLSMQALPYYQTLGCSHTPAAG